MKKNKRKFQIEDTVLDNDDYFFRDSEMFRAQVENPKHKINETYDISHDIRDNERRGME